MAFSCQMTHYIDTLLIMNIKLIVKGNKSLTSHKLQIMDSDRPNPDDKHSYIGLQYLPLNLRS